MARTHSKTPTTFGGPERALWCDSTELDIVWPFDERVGAIDGDAEATLWSVGPEFSDTIVEIGLPNLAEGCFVEF